MAVIRQRLNRKNADEKYDVIHLETEASIVLLSDGRNVESALADLTSKTVTTITVVPWQSNTIIFTGGPQNPEWGGYDPSIMTMSGTTTASAVGEYTVVFTLKKGYQWSDGTIEKSSTWEIKRKQVSDVPSQNGTLTYTGSVQQPTWNGYDSAAMVMSGDTSGTDAGDYSTTVSLNAGYAWPDGTTEPKSVRWSINRTVVATPTQSGSITYNGGARSPSWDGYDRNKLIIGGDTEGTYPGQYTATFTPTKNYKWADGTTGAKQVTWSILSETISVPSQSESLTYNGASLTPKWSNYNSAKMTIGGTTSAVNAGAHTATFTPKTGYVWPDGTSVEKSVTWSIGQAAGSMSLSATSVAFTKKGETKTITVTRSGTGTISATSSNTSVATCSVSGNIVTITSGTTNGSCTITISVGSSTNYSAPSSKTVGVTRTVFTVPTTLGATTTWAGHTWTVVHVTSDRVYLALNRIYEMCQFNSNGSTAYSDSNLAARAKAFENTLASNDLTNALNTTVNGVTAKIFVCSYEQANGGFDYFAVQGQRICKDSNGAAQWWWTSSPYSGGYVYYVAAGGSFGSYGPAATRGFRPFVALSRN